MGIVAPDLKVLSRNSMKSRIDKMYTDEKERLINDLGKVSSVSLTTDTWTSNSCKSFITVTEHHIDDCWTMCSNVLVTREMPERHTGENLSTVKNDKHSCAESCEGDE